MPRWFGELVEMSLKVSNKSRVVICIPVFEDWESLETLVPQLGQFGERLGRPVEVVLVDDGSTIDAPRSLAAPTAGIARLTMLRLRRNVGHQRAICIGLCYINDNIAPGCVVIMDGDGEDRVSDVPTLIAEFDRHNQEKAVFAKRGKRMEGLRFRLGYAAYKILHLALTGRKVEVGNFSVLPRSLLERLVVVDDLWNHYAAALHHARLPCVSISIDRGARLAGRSKMNTQSLVIHGLSALSVFSEQIGVRLLIAACITFLLTCIGVAVVVVIRFATTFAIPGWATTAVGLLLILAALSCLLATGFVLLVLQGRIASLIVPSRDYLPFIMEVVSYPPRGHVE